MSNIPGQRPAEINIGVFVCVGFWGSGSRVPVLGSGSGHRVLGRFEFAPLGGHRIQDRTVLVTPLRGTLRTEQV